MKHTFTKNKFTQIYETGQDFDRGGTSQFNGTENIYIKEDRISNINNTLNDTYMQHKIGKRRKN